MFKQATQATMAVLIWTPGVCLGISGNSVRSYSEGDSGYSLSSGNSESASNSDNRLKIYSVINSDLFGNRYSTFLGGPSKIKIFSQQKTKELTADEVTKHVEFYYKAATGDVKERIVAVFLKANAKIITAEKAAAANLAPAVQAIYGGLIREVDYTQIQFEVNATIAGNDTNKIRQAMGEFENRLNALERK